MLPKALIYDLGTFSSFGQMLFGFWNPMVFVVVVKFLLVLIFSLFLGIAII